MDFLHDCAAYVFDMDGLLFDTERLSRRALHAAAEELGVGIAEDTFFELIGRRMRDIQHLLAQRVGSEELAARLMKCSEQHYSVLLEQGVPVKDGVAELLAWLHAQQRPCAVATSTGTARAEFKLTKTGLRQYFHTVVGGDLVERGKPAPDIYLRAMAGLGIAPARCGVFEDSEPGIHAAHAAGARVVWVPDLAPVDAASQKLASARVDSLRAVLEVLRAGRQ